MAAIFWDTHLFIYLFEQNDAHGAAVLDLWDRMKQRRDHLMTSAFTLGEILVRPFASGDQALADRYQTLFTGGAVQVISFEVDCSILYARIRADKSIRPPDAIQLACASAAGADLFVTNDSRLTRKIIPGGLFVSSLENVPV